MDRPRLTPSVSPLMARASTVVERHLGVDFGGECVWTQLIAAAGQVWLNVQRGNRHTDI